MPGSQNGATIRVASQAIIEVRPAALGQIWHPPETISRRPEQMYCPSDTRLEWLGKGLLLFKSDSKKRWRAKMQPLFESFPGPLLKSVMGPLASLFSSQHFPKREKSGLLNNLLKLVHA